MATAAATQTRDVSGGAAHDRLMSADSTPTSSRANSMLGSRASRFSEAVSSSSNNRPSAARSMKDRLTRPFTTNTRTASQASDVSALDIDPTDASAEHEHDRSGLTAREYPDMEAGYSAAQHDADTGADRAAAGAGRSAWQRRLSTVFDTTALTHKLDKSRRQRVILFAAMNAAVLVFLLAVAAIWASVGVVKKHRTYALSQAKSQGSLAQELYS